MRTRRYFLLAESGSPELALGGGHATGSPPPRDSRSAIRPSFQCSRCTCQMQSPIMTITAGTENRVGHKVGRKRSLLNMECLAPVLAGAVFELQADHDPLGRPQQPERQADDDDRPQDGMDPERRGE